MDNAYDLYMRPRQIQLKPCFDGGRHEFRMLIEGVRQNTYECVYCGTISVIGKTKDDYEDTF